MLLLPLPVPEQLLTHERNAALKSGTVNSTKQRVAQHFIWHCYAPPGWQWVLIRTDEPADIDIEELDPIVQSDVGAGESAALDKEQQPDPIARLKAEAEDNIFREIVDPGDPGTPWNPGSGWRWEYNSYTKSWIAHRKEPGPKDILKAFQ